MEMSDSEPTSPTFTAQSFGSASRTFAERPFTLFGNKTDNVPNVFKCTLDETSEWTPKIRTMSKLTVRLATFNNWPRQMTQSAEEMARAGFFYNDRGDSTTCFWCGHSIFRWNAYENPVGEHKRIHGTCKFLEMAHK